MLFLLFRIKRMTCKIKNNIEYNRMKINFTVFLCFMFVLMGTSCASRKDVAYFQLADQYKTKKVLANDGVKIQADDLLDIMVNNKNPELAAPFNLSTLYSEASGSVGSTNTQVERLGYLVNQQGHIEFPILGAISVKGLTLFELANLVKKELVEKGYMEDPIVTVRLLNYKVAVLGEVNSPGTKLFETERVTILDAMSAAGDLTLYGKRDNVLLIREQNGERTMVRLDLTSTDLFESPYFYLQQNDVVYVEPVKNKINQRNSNPNVSIILSYLSFLTSLTSLVFIFAK